MDTFLEKAWKKSYDHPIYSDEILAELPVAVVEVLNEHYPWSSLSKEGFEESFSIVPNAEGKGISYNVVCNAIHYPRKPSKYYNFSVTATVGSYRQVYSHVTFDDNLLDDVGNLRTILGFITFYLRTNPTDERALDKSVKGIIEDETITWITPDILEELELQCEDRFRVIEDDKSWNHVYKFQYAGLVFIVYPGFPVPYTMYIDAIVVVREEEVDRICPLFLELLQPKVRGISKSSVLNHTPIKHVFDPVVLTNPKNLEEKPPKPRKKNI